MTSTPAARNWKQRADALKLETRALIGDTFSPSSSGNVFATLNPSTGQKLADVVHCQAEDVDRAVAFARKTFESGVWSRMDPKNRKQVLLNFASLIEKNKEDLALLETLDMGKPIGDSLNIDLPNVVETVSWCAEAIDKIYDQIAPTGHDVLGMITKEPMGIVAAVVPWNYPLLMAAWKFGPALAAGNCFILKPAEQSSLSSLLLAKIALEAGLPPGVFQVVPGMGETTGRAIGMHMDIDAVAFTGSGQVGRYFLEYSAKSNLKSVSLECGGKSPNIIFADCYDLDVAAETAAVGIFYNQGEVCSAGSRLLVERSIRDELVEKLQKTCDAYVPADPLLEETRMGAIVDTDQLDKIMSYIGRGKSEGADLVAGGTRAREETGGNFVTPTVFSNVSNSMAIAQEEIFGPVLSVIAFDSQEEAVRLANDTLYGLSSAVWTADLTRAHDMARAIRAGTVCVNCYNEGNITTPFGGFGESGFGGHDRALQSIEKYQETKATWIRLHRPG
ncbi:aldehyde dehydrogenase [Leisingera sp. S232]|uniref:aldehyde dehydrogenase n=1 Tax=Leisingera sp. S232 TaxID=3415132 RepID=UPI00086D27A7|nr:aldehyde dehydrogenase PuuC [Rhodobacteraceae bacterium (ex Bugula neritina AB1)]